MQQKNLTDVATRLNSVSIHLVGERASGLGLGCTRTALGALVLVFGGERTIAELAEAEQVTSPTMTRIVDGLAQSALAERRPHPQDGRATLVRATTKGRRIMERGRQRRIDLITGLLEPLSEEDMRALGRAVGALAKALEAESR